MKHTLIALWLCSAGVAHGASPDPLDAEAPTLPPPHNAALADYQPFDESTRDWPAANRAVQEAGGWRAYLREAESSAPVAPHHHASPTQP